VGNAKRVEWRELMVVGWIYMGSERRGTDGQDRSEVELWAGR